MQGAGRKGQGKVGGGGYGGAGRDGCNGCAAAQQPQFGAPANRPGLTIAATAAFCTEGAGNNQGVEGGGGGRLGPLREVGRKDEGGTVAWSPPV